MWREATCFSPARTTTGNIWKTLRFNIDPDSRPHPAKKRRERSVPDISRLFLHAGSAQYVLQIWRLLPAAAYIWVRTKIS